MRLQPVRLNMLRLIALLLLPLLAACGFEAKQDQLFDNYLGRLSTTLAVETPDKPPLNTIELSAKRELEKEIPRISMGILQSYRFRQCGLFQVIAEKNSILGKVQDHFANFDYQLRLLTALDNCLNNAELSEQERLTLVEIREQKTKHLPMHWHNLMVLSDEIRGQLSRSSWLREEDFTLTGQAAPAFRALLSPQLKPDGNYSEYQEVTPFQQTLETTLLAGPLIYSMRRSSQWLDLTTELLKQNNHKIICANNRNRQTFDYLRNIFYKYYIDELQQYISRIDQLYLELSPYMPELYKPFGTEQAVDPVQEHAAFRQSVKLHTQFWQNTFQRCGYQISSGS